MNILINNQEYEYYEDISGNPTLRRKLIEFIDESFECDFSNWVKLGYWTNKYEPHVLVKNQEIVATITVNYMQYTFGQTRNYIQLGGVVTREAYRGEGLSSWLMHYILEKWKDNCDQIFLISNDSAVDFYRKMGFEKTVEYMGVYQWKRNIYSEKKLQIRKMDIFQKEDRELLLHCYEQSNPFSAFVSKKCGELVVFYGLEYLHNCFYYFSELDAVVVAETYENRVVIDDIYGKISFSSEDEGMKVLHTIVKNVMESNQMSGDEVLVEFGFSPIESLTEIKSVKLEKEDDTMFLLADKENLFLQNQIRFPVLSHN